MDGNIYVGQSVMMLVPPHLSTFYLMSLTTLVKAIATPLVMFIGHHHAIIMAIYSSDSLKLDPEIRSVKELMIDKEHYSFRYF